MKPIITDSVEGGIGFSYIVNIEVIDAGNQTYIIAPNPVSTQSKLIFDRENQEEATITFFNENGLIVHEVQSREQSVSINRSQFRYLFLCIEFRRVMKDHSWENLR